ncbi:GGDEF domain-containing protein [Sneathiella marina]|uniref:diguanylate cyclase n=1 Tax=Sneathiella marina TaxID=2950108 RepID=A0ABY4VZ10_9PROT|nr:GGDEF domain-containing protein [Sneathiella marina]USG60156.1 GGDEF domain-containing protein [Sneathiella marina]
MTANMSALPATGTGLAFGAEQEVPFHLENLAKKIKNSPHNSANPQYWQTINRVIAYAASAEQHISEQQARIRELEELSSTDELTGLPNRRGLQEFMARMLSISRRHDEQGVLAFLDLDDFKIINDHYGHETGDRLLNVFAKALKSSLRDSDFVARIGGDEFVFVLVRSSEENGINRARAIQQQIGSSFITAQGKELPLRASLGVAAFNGEATLAQLLRSADLDMYKDKRARKT